MRRAFLPLSPTAPIPTRLTPPQLTTHPYPTAVANARCAHLSTTRANADTLARTTTKSHIFIVAHWLTYQSWTLILLQKLFAASAISRAVLLPIQQGCFLLAIHQQRSAGIPWPTFLSVPLARRQLLLSRRQSCAGRHGHA